jgi:hypothetical protein
VLYCIVAEVGVGFDVSVQKPVVVPNPVLQILLFRKMLRKVQTREGKEWSGTLANFEPDCPASCLFQPVPRLRQSKTQLNHAISFQREAVGSKCIYLITL